MIVGSRNLRGCLVFALVVGCDGSPSIPSPASAATTEPPSPVVVTLLYTADEHGWLLPLVEKGATRGGAAHALAQWMAEEKHCPGAHPSPIDGVGQDAGPGAARRAAERSSPACTDPSTLLLSGGDNWTGPALSSYYDGVPMAEAMARMGYVATAFGNHDFDFGRESFLKNRAIGGFPFLAANLRVTDESLKKEMTLPSHILVERRGVKIGVVGLATVSTLKTAMASRFKGIEFDAEEPALGRAIGDAWKAGADAVVVIAHECADKLQPMLERHPEWNISFMGAGHCHKRSSTVIHGAPLIGPGWRLHSYARVRLTIDKTRPSRARVLSVVPEMVEVEHPTGMPFRQPDADLDQRANAWKQRIDGVLGEQIGFAAWGFETKSDEAGHWIGHSWRKELGVDVAIVNRGGIRQALAKGSITKNSVYSVLPFDNRLVVLDLKGSDLVRSLDNPEAIAVGVTRSAKGGFVDDQGKPVDPERHYSVATIDFLYFGGDGFNFEAQDPSPKETGLDWRAPVIEWTRKQATTPAAPLERALGVVFKRD